MPHYYQGGPPSPSHIPVYRFWRNPIEYRLLPRRSVLPGRHDKLVSPCGKFYAWVESGGPLQVQHVKKLERGMQGYIESPIGQYYRIHVQAPHKTGLYYFPRYLIEIWIEGRLYFSDYSTGGLISFEGYLHDGEGVRRCFFKGLEPLRDATGKRMSDQDEPSTIEIKIIRAWVGTHATGRHIFPQPQPENNYYPVAITQQNLINNQHTMTEFAPPTVTSHEYNKPLVFDPYPDDYQNGSLTTLKFLYMSKEPLQAKLKALKSAPKPTVKPAPKPTPKLATDTPEEPQRGHEIHLDVFSDDEDNPTTLRAELQKARDERDKIHDRIQVLKQKILKQKLEGLPKSNDAKSGEVEAEAVPGAAAAEDGKKVEEDKEAGTTKEGEGKEAQKGKQVEGKKRKRSEKGVDGGGAGESKRVKIAEEVEVDVGKKAAVAKEVDVDKKGSEEEDKNEHAKVEGKMETKIDDEKEEGEVEEEKEEGEVEKDENEDQVDGEKVEKIGKPASKKGGKKRKRASAPDDTGADEKSKKRLKPVTSPVQAVVAGEVAASEK